MAEFDGGTPGARADLLRVRRGTARQWADENPVLADGEEVVELDTGIRKRGDRDRTPYNQLPDVNALPASRVAAGLALVLGG